MIRSMLKRVVPYKWRVIRANRRELRTSASDNPLLHGYSQTEADRDGTLRAAYDDYVRSISSPRATMSYELACVLTYTLKRVGPRVTVELGSGFSSYVARRYQADWDPSCKVVSCDDDPQWLARTGDFLRARSLSDAGLMLWEEYLATRADAVPGVLLHDLGHSPTRIRELPRVLRWCRRGAVVLLDDMHKPALQRAALAEIRAGGLRAYDMAPVTLDQYGRFAWMVMP